MPLDYDNHETGNGKSKIKIETKLKTIESRVVLTKREKCFYTKPKNVFCINLYPLLAFYFG